jgi:hypothetical protein
MRAFTNTERRIIVLAQEKGIYNRSAKSKLPAFREAKARLVADGFFRYAPIRMAYFLTDKGFSAYERIRGKIKCD